MNIAIIQARTGSTRLPGKVLMRICGKSVLEHVVERVMACSLIDEIFVATTIAKDDIGIVKLCCSRNIRVFCGSENDVLDRFYQLAKLIQPTNIVRITSDCPIIDPIVIDNIISQHMFRGVDYTSNTLIETYPDGLDTEVFTYKALNKAWTNAKLNSEREHVTPYIKNHSEKFTHHSVISVIDYSKKRWTLDTEQDFQLISFIFENLYPTKNNFGIDDVLSLLERYPEIEHLNAETVRNEGYIKSLLND
jgi:spore coat polysaccharide biosynthesis protein SpsF (cytidylyltransferase family)